MRWVNETQKPGEGGLSPSFTYQTPSSFLPAPPPVSRDLKGRPFQMGINAAAALKHRCRYLELTKLETRCSGMPGVTAAP